MIVRTNFLIRQPTQGVFDSCWHDVDGSIELKSTTVKTKAPLEKEVWSWQRTDAAASMTKGLIKVCSIDFVVQITDRKCHASLD